MDAPTCALLGAMGPLLQKLDSVMAPGSTLHVPEEVKDELELLVQGVKKIHTSLMDLSEAEDPPLTAKLWMKGVREISYDMEDYFDQVMHLGTSINLDAVPRAPVRSSGLLKVARLYKRQQKWRSPMAAVILEFRARVQDALERCQRYGLDSLTFQRRFVSYGPRLPPRHEHQVHDYYRSVYKLDGMLSTEGNTQVKVVSIIGPGGVGKTTLAKIFYQKLQERFDCRAFVRVSGNPDMRRLLTSLFFQIQKQQPHESWDANDLIDNIARCLQGKRYFIIIDDLWSSSLWDIISRGFPECGCYSRIITTTHIEDVALACCGYDSAFIFELTQSDQFSRQLFFKTVFHDEYYCPEELKQVSYEIIRQCGGLPLSTANIAGLFACEPVMLVEHWRHILQSLCLGSRTCTSSSHEHMKEESPPKLESIDLESVSNKDFTTKPIDHWPENTSEIYEPLYTSLKTGDSPEGMKRTLSLVYSSLPAHLKTCLLYLSMYPEDYTINRNDLVNQWIAEGFLIASKGQDIEEVACGFFDELVSRGLIQPVETDCTDKVLSCTVHHTVLNFIAHKSMEDNFVSIVHNFGTALGHADKVRRLSAQFGGAKSAILQAGTRISQVHSVMFFGFVKCVPPIVEYKLLRVLILHVWSDENKTSFDLARISELYLLRYLKIVCNISVKLPAQMRGLKFLETFEVDAAVDSVPSDIVYLQRLLHLCLPSGIALPHGMYRRISLRKLGYFDLSSNYEDNVMYLDNLINLHNLQLTCCTVPSNSECVGLALEKLPSCLRSLTMAPVSLHARSRDAGIYGKCNAFGSLSDPPTLIERLELSWRICTFSSLPKWILELRNLCILNIAVREISWFDIVVLKRLPTLAALSLHVQVAPSRLIIIDKEGFPFLTYFKFRCSFFCLSFLKGAMPKLQRLKLVFDLSKDRGFNCEHTGLDQLSMLQKISAKVWPARVDIGLDKKSAESYVEAAIIKSVRNSIIVNIRCVNWISDDDEKNWSQEQQHGSFSMYDTGQKEDSVRSPHASKFLRPTGSSCAHQDFNVAVVKKKKKTLLKPYSDAPIRELNKVGSKPALVIGDAMVSVSTGAMNSIIQKLGTLMGERYMKDTITWKMAITLKDEIDVMNAFLEKLLGTAKLNLRMKDWKKQVRETTYDIEDCIDECFDQHEKGVSHMLKEVIHKTQNLTKQIKRADLGGTLHKTETHSLEFKVYDNSIIGHVGMDGPRDKLKRWASGHEQNLQVLCILGARGLGKTTLAIEVYNMIRERFDHQVVVPVSQNMDSEGILICILSQVQSISYNTHMRMESLQYAVQRCLKDKRYLLLIDGVCSAQILEAIVPALPKNDVGSVIITTTHINDVAESCAKHLSCFTYRMDPLSSEDSLILFRRIVFGSERNCPSAVANICEKIVKACGGIPFAITVIAGVLAIKPTDMARWTVVEKQITMTGMHCHTEEGMRKILDFCYSDLSRDMKTCLLYLSAFPKNHVIQKCRLIRRWNAEGFLPKRNEETWWETGESYFLELIARKLIRPVYDEDEYDDEVPMCCKVYGLVHDFITSRSNEENLVSYEMTNIAMSAQKNDMTRRLMIDLSNNIEKDIKLSMADLVKGKWNISPHKIRSLAFSGDASKMPDLSTYKFIRVLDLEGTKALSYHQLVKIIKSLFLLRYLGLRGTGVDELPQQIMYLEHLSTLDIRQTKVTRIPPVSGNWNLVSLFGDALELSGRFSYMEELEELSTIKISSRDCVHYLREIMMHNRLRVLGVKFDLIDLNMEEADKVLSEFFWVIRRSTPQSLFLYDYPCDLLRLSYFCSSRSQLRRVQLRMSGILSKLPWDLTYLEALTHLHVTVDVLEMNDLDILGDMPRLVLLNLTSGSGTSTRGRCIVTYGGFQCLKVFCYNFHDSPMALQFKEGSMPQLRRLRLEFNAQKTNHELFDFRFGIEHLSNLVQVRATIHCQDATVSDAKIVEVAIRKQVSQNPNNPVLQLIRRAEGAKPYSMKMKKDSNLLSST